jgi:hypothetical protein
VAIFFDVKEIMHMSGECRSGTGGILSYNTNISLTWGLQRGNPLAVSEGVLRMRSIRRRGK